MRSVLLLALVMGILLIAVSLPGQNVNPMLGTTYGQIWQRVDNTASVTSPYPLTLPANTQVLATPGFASQTIGLGFPIAIIPVGWSLVTANANNAGTIYTSFWFQLANE